MSVERASDDCGPLTFKRSNWTTMPDFGYDMGATPGQLI